jgi:hypothetical protein
MIRKSLSELREQMRGVARGERHASPLPAAPLLAVLTPEAMELLGVLLREHPSSIRRLSIHVLPQLRGAGWSGRPRRVTIYQ